MKLSVTLAAAAFLAGTSAQAADTTFTLRGGVASGPAYFGADAYEIKPDIGFSLGALNIGPLSFGDPDMTEAPQGLSFGGSFRYIAPRDASEFGALAGLDDIDATAELGIGARYHTQNFAAFADLRQGIGGHQGVVGEVGADVILRPDAATTFSFGPRALFGNAEYTDTYFGVSAGEASALNPAYDADGGLVSVGAEMVMTVRINDVWGVETGVTWDRYMNDAADSPIVENGRREDWGARVGLTRTFQLGF